MIQMVRVTLILCMLICMTTGSALGHSDTCPYCGMLRSIYGHSWIIIALEDGTETGFCSIHCAAINMALNSHQRIKRITVGDYLTHKQIDAEKAYWVVGGQKTGVMTARAKWAFETQAGAAAFIKNNGGHSADFEKAIKAAFEDMYEDILMIRKKRRMNKIRRLPSQQ